MLHHIENKTSKSLAGIKSIPFNTIADYALSQGYELSLVFVTSEISRKINKQYRGKDKPTNILSFPLEKNEGEILIDLQLIKKRGGRY